MAKQIFIKVHIVTTDSVNIEMQGDTHTLSTFLKIFLDLDISKDISYTAIISLEESGHV